MELELKHLAPYLPYGLKVKYNRPNEKVDILTNLYNIDEYDTIKLSIGWDDAEHIWMYKPILRPMPDLSSELFNETCACLGLYTSADIDFVISQPTHLAYSDMPFLLKHHFDIFGLVPNLLAIDINTLSPNVAGNP